MFSLYALHVGFSTSCSVSWKSIPRTTPAIHSTKYHRQFLIYTGSIHILKPSTTRHFQHRSSMDVEMLCFQDPTKSLKNVLLVSSKDANDTDIFSIEWGSVGTWLDQNDMCSQNPGSTKTTQCKYGWKQTNITIELIRNDISYYSYLLLVKQDWVKQVCLGYLILTSHLYRMQHPS